MQTKKSLGQHFLKSQKAVRTMVLASLIKEGDIVLEIGPGMGVLTDELLKTGCSVITVEKDDRLIPILTEKYKNEIASGQLNLIHADILDFNMSKCLFNIGMARGTLANYKLVANIPYYITGQIIRMFLESENQPEQMTLLVQKEVADRIVAHDDKESLLSLSVKAYGEPKLIEKVPRGAFAPAPNVDSAIITISNISKNNFTEALPRCNEKKFFNLIHAGFAHKRKQILPNLSEIYQKEKVLEALNKIGIPITTRAEDIPISKWFELLKNLT